MIPALKIPALQPNRAPSPPSPLSTTWNDEGFALPHCPAFVACPWRQELGWGSQRAPPGSAQPQLGHTSSRDGNNSPGTTSTAQTRHGRGCKQGEAWKTTLERGRGSSSRAWALVGAHRCLYSGIWEGQVPKSQTTAGGFVWGCSRRAARAAHLAQAEGCPTKSKSWK